MLASWSGSRNSHEHVIDEVDTTSERMTGRAGLSLFVRYLRHLAVAPHLERLFGSIRKSRKGLPVVELFKQVFCFVVDGSSRHLSYFDELAADAGYAGAIETAPDRMASSHMIKRFFGAFSFCRVWLFRALLQKLFVWRLKIEQPELVVLGIDTMPMDNDDAERREGVEPTYKRFKGFQPLQMTWGRFVVDAVFRGGSKHSNNGQTAPRMIRHLVQLVRDKYRADVPIIVRSDSGFFDEKIFALCEGLGIGYVCTGKLYGDIRQRVEASDDGAFGRYDNGEQTWEFLELGDRRGTWERFRRAIFTTPRYEDGQGVLEFARPDSVIYTNLGLGDVIDERLRETGHAELLQAERVIELCHGRGRDELVHRRFKELASERLPFRRFEPNAALYYTMLVAYFLAETFKQDVCPDVVPISSYPTRLRRSVLDIAGKIVRTGGKTILKVTEATWQRLRLQQLWERSGDPPRFAWA